MNPAKPRRTTRNNGARATEEAVAQLETIRRGKSLSPRMFTPDRVLDTAYCFYVVALLGEQRNCPEAEINKLASKVVEAFQWTCDHAEAGTKEWQFMTALQQIVVSLSRGIYRRKQIYEKNLQTAVQKKEMQVAEITQVTRQEGFLRSCLRALLLGGFGFALVRAIAPSLSIADSANPNYASLTAAIALILLGAVVKGFIMNRKIIRIFDDYDRAQLHANISYQQAALEEYTRAEMAACNAWEQFTGEKPLNWPGFEEVLRTDLARQQRLEDERDRLQQNPWTKAMGMLRKLGAGNPR